MLFRYEQTLNSFFLFFDSFSRFDGFPKKNDIRKNCLQIFWITFCFQLVRRNLAWFLSKIDPIDPNRIRMWKKHPNCLAKFVNCYGMCRKNECLCCRFPFRSRKIFFVGTELFNKLYLSFDSAPTDWDDARIKWCIRLSWTMIVKENNRAKIHGACVWFVLCVAFDGFPFECGLDWPLGSWERPLFETSLVDAFCGSICHTLGSEVHFHL